jgi:hypothetical protein
MHRKLSRGPQISRYFWIFPKLVIHVMFFHHVFANYHVNIKWVLSRMSLPFWIR